MFKPRAIIGLVIAALFVAACGNGAGPRASVAWFLDPGASSISFISVKNGDVVEPNRFGAMNGSISRDGRATVEIQAASVDTGIDTRDERLRRYIFATEEYPLISVETEVDLDEFSDLDVGADQLVELELAVTIAGRTNTLFANVRVTRAARDRVVLTTIDPVLVDTRDYGMEDGLDTLVELASLDAITPVIPVSVYLVFERS